MQKRNRRQYKTSGGVSILFMLHSLPALLSSLLSPQVYREYQETAMTKPNKDISQRESTIYSIGILMSCILI